MTSYFQLFTFVCDDDIFFSKFTSLDVVPSFTTNLKEIQTWSVCLWNARVNCQQLAICSRSKKNWCPHSWKLREFWNMIIKVSNPGHSPRTNTLFQTGFFYGVSFLWIWHQFPVRSWGGFTKLFLNWKRLNGYFYCYWSG